MAASLADRVLRSRKVIVLLAFVGSYVLIQSGLREALRHLAPNSLRHPSSGAVGTHPAGVGISGRTTPLATVPGDELAAFSAGCFWGSEEVFRKMPGIVATAVGYMGGTSAFPDEALAHRTGHAETVLVEFNHR